MTSAAKSRNGIAFTCDKGTHRVDVESYSYTDSPEYYFGSATERDRFVQQLSGSEEVKKFKVDDISYVNGRKKSQLVASATVVIVRRGDSNDAMPTISFTMNRQKGHPTKRYAIREFSPRVTISGDKKSRTDIVMRFHTQNGGFEIPGEAGKNLYEDLEPIPIDTTWESLKFEFPSETGTLDPAGSLLGRGCVLTTF